MGIWAAAKVQEIDRREKPEVRSTERQIGRQRTGDQAVDGPEKIREIVADSERQEDEGDQAPMLRPGLSHLSAGRRFQIRRVEWIARTLDDHSYAGLSATVPTYVLFLETGPCCRPPERQQRTLVSPLWLS